MAKDNGQAVLVEEPTKAETRLRLGSDHERKIAREALEHRSDELDKLAKKNLDEGYPKLGRIVQGDASLIRHELLPQVRDYQTRIDESHTLRNALLRITEPKIRASLPLKVDITKWDREREGEKAANAIAETLEDYILHVAETAWAAGFNAREAEPEKLALRCADTYQNPSGN